MDSFQNLRTKILKPRVRATIQLNFLKRLSRSLSNGYSMLSALETLKWDKNLYYLADEVSKHLKNGHSLDFALDKMHFHPIITNYLYFAKDYGNLEESIEKCLVLYERRLENTKKFTRAIRYPIILIILFSIAFFFIQHQVLPNLLNLFQQNEQDASIVQLAINISSISYYSVITLILVALVTRWIWHYMKIKIPIEKQIHIYRLLPIYRSYVRLNTSFLFSTHVESLLKTGLSIKDVIAVLSTQQKLPIIMHYAKHITKGLNQGIPLGHIMGQLNFISPQLASIFQKNSNSDSLEKDLATYSSFLTDELNERIVKVITYVQPIFFILLGLIIILIYLSLMLPMYQFIETI
jgi:competence protein ComGB